MRLEEEWAWRLAGVLVGLLSIVVLLAIWGGEMKKTLKRFAAWLFWDTKVPLGRLAPYVLGLSIWRWPRKVKRGE